MHELMSTLEIPGENAWDWNQRTGQSEDKKLKRKPTIGVALVALIVALGVGAVVLQKRTGVQAAGIQAPRFEVDPMWPKPLPNHWIL
jgi:hypothetical protein